MQVLTDKQAIDYITMCCFNRRMDKRIINAPYILEDKNQPNWFLKDEDECSKETMGAKSPDRESHQTVK